MKPRSRGVSLSIKKRQPVRLIELRILLFETSFDSMPQKVKKDRVHGYQIDKAGLFFTY
jgi:hypothetical protein